MSRISAVLFFIIFALACSAPQNQNFKQQKQNQGKIEELIPVEVAFPRITDISSFLLFSSNIDSEGVAEIYPQTSGIIMEIYFDEGDRVQKGAVLARIDDREAALTEAKSRLNYEQLQKEFERQKELFDQNLISEDTFEKIKFNLERARLDWETARLNLSFTRIISPINGFVSKRYIKAGNKIQISQPAFKVVQASEKIATVNIPESERSSIYLKQPAFVISGEIEIPASVLRISPAIDAESGTFKTTLAINDSQNRLAIGQFVNVKIIKKTHHNALTVSKDALIFEEGNVYVFVVGKDNKAHRVKVETGFEEGKLVEIVKGLSRDDSVVTAGKNSLKDGSKVKIISR